MDLQSNIAGICLITCINCNSATAKPCQPDKELQSTMKRAQIRRYICVQFEDYAAIGTMYDAAVQAGYQSIGFE